jgi:site-specific DNA-methyltransferase (adenine-specific)
MMTVQLFQGDCLEVMPTLPAQSVDAIITDLPYGTTACKWDDIIPFDPMWLAIKRILKPNGIFITTASQPFTSALVMSNPAWFRYELIWEKNQGSSPGLAKYRPMPAHENILIFGKGVYNPQMRSGFKPWKRIDSGKKLKNEHGYGYKNQTGFVKQGGETRYPLSVIKVNYIKGCNKQLHPTQKPVDLYEYLIKTYTNPGETVLDFCFGSCTTGEACIKTGRNFIGIEKDPSYFAIGETRIQQAQMQPVMFSE